MEKIYKIKSTHSSSDRFGPCEVCNKPATEVFYQKTFIPYFSIIRGCISKSMVKSQFGHEQCLLDQREEPCTIQ